jgi:IS605 OrfB family transposase
VAKAKDTRSGIALEDLKGIRESITVRKAQRRQHTSWAFDQLRRFIEYKAKLNGVPVVFVDPRNTSRECPKCGYTSKSNRKTQSGFVCNSCGFAGLADYVAALNIKRRAAGNQPYVATERLATSACAIA